MDINVSTHGIRIDTGTESFVREQIQSALQRFEEQVVSVDAFLKDINGPRGGVDKHVVLAIWGVESNYGDNKGDKNVIQSLMTLACSGTKAVSVSPA